MTLFGGTTTATNQANVHRSRAYVNTLMLWCASVESSKWPVRFSRRAKTNTNIWRLFRFDCWTVISNMAETHHTYTRAVKTYVYIALWMSWPTDNSVNACVTGAMATLLLYEWDDVCLQIYTYLYVVVRGTPMRCEHSIATLGIAVQLNQQHIETEIVIFAPEKISMFMSMMMMTSVVM